MNLPAEAKLLFETTVQCRWSEQDVYKHINNTAYLQYFEQARVEWLQAIGFPVDGNGEGPVVVQNNVTYKLPVNYPSTLLSRVYGGRVGRSSFVMYQTLSLVQQPDVITTFAEVNVVWVDVELMKSVPLPQSAIDCLINGGQVVS